MEDQSNPRPSLKVSGSQRSNGNEQCCHVPSMSTNFRSTMSAWCFLASEKKSSGFIAAVPRFSTGVASEKMRPAVCRGRKDERRTGMDAEAYRIPSDWTRACCRPDGPAAPLRGDSEFVSIQQGSEGEKAHSGLFRAAKARLVANSAQFRP